MTTCDPDSADPREVAGVFASAWVGWMHEQIAVRDLGSNPISEIELGR